MATETKVRAVRMSDDLWELIEEESAPQHSSGAQFLREAAIWRLAYHSTRRGEFELDHLLSRLAATSRACGRGPGLETRVR